MINLHILGSSSSGNCLILQAKKNCLVLDAGINFSEVKKALDFNISSIAGVLLGHRDIDHSRHANAFTKYGIDIYSSEETFADLKIATHRSIICFHKVKFNIDEWEIMPFDLKHHVRCFGYVIQHPDMGRLAYITDTSEIPYKIPGLHHLLVEANFDLDILDNNARTNKVYTILRQRIQDNHMSIQNTVEYVKRCDQDSLRSIWLLHLSSTNSNARQFRETIERSTGKVCHIAERGVYELD